MRKDSLLAGAVCIVIFGCVTQPRRGSDSEKVRVGPNRIEIVAKTEPGIHSGTVTSHYYAWTLEKHGKSHGSILNTDFATTVTLLELPTTVYDDFLAMIEMTQFFQMKSTSAPPAPVDGSLRSIEVRYDGQKHVVTQTGAAAIDPGFNRMWMLIRDVQDRSTIIRNK